MASVQRTHTHTQETPPAVIQYTAQHCHHWVSKDPPNHEIQGWHTHPSHCLFPPQGALSTGQQRTQSMTQPDHMIHCCSWNRRTHPHTHMQNKVQATCVLAVRAHTASDGGHPSLPSSSRNPTPSYACQQHFCSAVGQYTRPVTPQHQRDWLQR